MNWLKRFLKGLSKQRQKEYDEFITEYRKLIDKYKFDFKAEIVYTPDGIFPVWKVIDLTKVQNSQAQSNDTDTTSQRS